MGNRADHAQMGRSFCMKQGEKSMLGVMEAAKITEEICPVCGDRVDVRHGLLYAMTDRIIHENKCDTCGEEYIFAPDCPICMTMIEDRRKT